MSSTSWPHKLSDYPEKYIDWLKETNGPHTDEEIAEWLEREGLTPSKAPKQFVVMDTSMRLLFEKGHEPQEQPHTFLGMAPNDLSFDHAGDAYFLYDAIHSEQVADQINFCRRMFRGPWELYCGALRTPEFLEYYIGISDKRDESTYKLRYGNDNF